MVVYIQRFVCKTDQNLNYLMKISFISHIFVYLPYRFRRLHIHTDHFHCDFLLYLVFSCLRSSIGCSHENSYTDIFQETGANSLIFSEDLFLWSWQTDKRSLFLSSLIQPCAPLTKSNDCSLWSVSMLMVPISLLYWFPSGARRFGSHPLLFLNSWRSKSHSCLSA